MRRAARTDDNQAAIVCALHGIGAFVQSLAAIGDGCPDLLVGHAGKTFLFEVKNPKQPPSKRQKTPAQLAWHYGWHGGPLWIVHSPEEVIGIVTGSAANF